MKPNLSASVWIAIACLWVQAFSPAMAGTPTSEVVDISAFGAIPGNQNDTTPAVVAALERCRVTHARKLVFPAGQYHFWPDRATEEYLFVSNNDEGAQAHCVFPVGAGWAGD